MADAKMLDGTRMTCWAMRLHWDGRWHCTIAALHMGRDGHPACDAVFSFQAVCDDFGNLVRVPS